MPELPEVERARKVCDEHCVGKRVESVITLEGGGGPRHGIFDDKVLKPGHTHMWESALVGSTLTATRRVGKRTIWDFNISEASSSSSSPSSHSVSVVLGFGMTGALTVKGVESQKFKEFKVYDEIWPPRWTKLELVFEDGTRIAYSDSRRFGKIQLLGVDVDPLTVAPLKQLAHDPLRMPLPSKKAFSARLKSKACVVKAALLNQNFVLCGLGNWLVDDVLFAAGVHPNSLCSSLSDSACSNILQSAHEICKEAVRCDADSERFPKEWLFHKRWGIKKRRGKDDDGKPLRTLKGGHPIRVGDFAGRTTLWVPALQKLEGSSASTPVPKSEHGGKRVNRGTARSRVVNKRRKTSGK